MLLKGARFVFDEGTSFRFGDCWGWVCRVLFPRVRVVFSWELSVESYVIRDNNLSRLVLFRRSLPSVRGGPVGRVVESSFWCSYL